MSISQRSAWRRTLLAALLCGASFPVWAQDGSDITYSQPQAPSLNMYGVPGVLDMPSAEMLPDGQAAFSYSYAGGISRYNMTFQAFPWLSATFRYSGIQDLDLYGFDTYYDRSFDLRLRLLKEGHYAPAVTLGLQDIAGTGLNASEYIVAGKHFTTPGLSPSGEGQLHVTAGLGWGRLGSMGAFTSTGSRPSYDSSSSGGQLSADQWFRGDVAPFAGIEWDSGQNWSLKAEYSSDAYVTETEKSDVFERKSSFNFGAEYQVSDTTRIGAYYLYGSIVGVSAQFQLNPRHEITPLVIAAPDPVPPRRDWAEESDWDPSWAQSETSRSKLFEDLKTALADDGILIESLTLHARSVDIRYRNPRYQADTLAVGRIARILARYLPATVETFRIVPMVDGMAASAVTISRTTLEDTEYLPDATDTVWAGATVGDAPAVGADAQINGDLYPKFSWALTPYTKTSYFDPSEPFRLDVGAQLAATWQFSQGWKLAGAVRQRVWGNIKDGRLSNSVLPHVRTDQTAYAQEDTTLKNLYLQHNWKMAPDIYARASAGLFEEMYGGVSGEVLWKQADNPLAFGAELNYVKQRDYDQLFDFRDYDVVTGHVSAYYRFEDYLLEVDAGRYLAGDYGATVSLDRIFDNGWSVGAFATVTDVSSEEFGEGSFDKGVRFSVPIAWLTGDPNRSGYGMTIRPTQRDGGQRVYVPGRLYEDIRGKDNTSLTQQKAGFWQ
ncbi:YjbH domain-containing protein [Thioclava sp. GXIMD2076]|uniref:YjbH domain-containing protein n=1 Tax=Thioclava sp. GXIMD2076 TaxID=3131931 RepID=UPI0030D1ACCD